MTPEPSETDPAALPVDRLVELLGATPAAGVDGAPADVGDPDRRERLRRYARAPRRPTRESRRAR